MDIVSKWGDFGGMGSQDLEGPGSDLRIWGSDLVGSGRRSHPLYYTPRARGSVLDKLGAENGRSIRSLIGCFRPPKRVMCA